jgi:predicted TIM-barrel fold metal-dependent hydrolase
VIIDVHTHICPPEIRDNRSDYVAHGGDAFASIYKDPKARLAGASELTSMMAEEGVDRSVAFGFPWSDRDTAMRHNDYILEAQSKFPNQIIGFGCFDPLASWATAEAERVLDAGLQGIGELAIYEHGFDTAALDAFSAIGEVCRKNKAPMMVHVNEPVGHKYPGKAPLTLPMIYDLVQRLSGIDLILAHMGGGLFFYGLLKKEVSKALERVYFDTAAVPFLYKTDIYQVAAEIVGAGKILFGTDYPLLRPSRYFKDIDQAGLDGEVQRLILGDAAAKLFK